MIYDVLFDQPASRVRFGVLIKTITGYELGGGVTSHPEEAIDMIIAGSIAQVRFDFKCMVRPGGVYFVNAGVLGVVDGAELYLDRLVDAVAFRVQPERNLLGGGVIDFGLQASYSIMKSATRASNADPS
jgi:lipopolysaccharide transport system ATP-binding protein